MSSFWDTTKYSIRQLLKSPGVVAVTILTLALTVGVNTAVFGVLYSVVFKPLPYLDSEKLVKLEVLSKESGVASSYFSATEFEELATEDKVFDHVGGYVEDRNVLSCDNLPIRAFGIRISYGYLKTLGVEPALGRSFCKEDFVSGRGQVIVISDQLWRNEFGARKDIVGLNVLLNGTSMIICGVMPEGYYSQFRDTSYWRPMILTNDEVDEGERFIEVICRLKEGVSQERLAGQLQLITENSHRFRIKNTNRDEVFTAKSLLEEHVGNSGIILWILYGVVSCVLLIGTVNIVNITVSRFIVRRKEFVVRMALGSGIRQIAWQLLVEYSILSLLSGITGIILANWSIRLLRIYAPSELSRIDEVTFDGMIVLYGLLLSLFVGFGVVFVSMLHLHRDNKICNLVLKSYGNNGRSYGHRFRFWLVTVQAAMVTVLLIGAGLFWSSFLNVVNEAPGFAADDLLSARIFLPQKDLNGNEARYNFYRQVIDRVETLPDVAEAGLVNSLPLCGVRFPFHLSLKGNASFQHSALALDDLCGDFVSVSQNYFGLMGIPLLKGRGFIPTDVNGTPVVVVSKLLVDRYFGDEEVLGSQLRIGKEKWRPWLTIVGVVDDVKLVGQDIASEPAFYVPYSQQSLPVWANRWMFLVVKSKSVPEITINNLRTELSKINSNLALANIDTMSNRLYESSARRRYHSGLMALMALLALVLALIGIYGVVSRTVLDRRHEVGVRMALGADNTSIFILTMVQGVKPALVGVLIGWLLSLACQDVLTGLLYGLSPVDPAIYAFVGVIIISTATLACFLPAKKAVSFDPMYILRYE